MANPQLENGFTSFANELIQAIYKTNLNGTEFRVVLFILYQTYGYKHKSRQLSIDYISKGTGIPFKSVQRSLKNLIDDGVVKATAKSPTSIKTLSINKNYLEWKNYTYLKNEVSELRYQNCGETYLKNEVKLASKVANKTIKNNTIKKKQERSSSQTTTTPPTLEEIKEYCQSKGYTFDCERFFYRYEPVGWIWQGSPIKNWRALADRWQITEKEEKAEQPKEEEPELDMWGKPIKPKWE